MDLSLEELERLVNEKRRRLELLQQLSEIDKRLEAQQPQDAAQQADTIVEIETTQIETTQSFFLFFFIFSFFDVIFYHYFVMIL